MKWYSKYLATYGKKAEEADLSCIDGIRSRIEAMQSSDPLITLAVIAYNEEPHIVSCLWSLSDLKTKYPIEIIVVDNDSSDRTAELIRQCGALYYKETQRSCGHARQCALNHARGKYYFTLDGDTLYPSCYVDMMMEKMKGKGVVAVGGEYTYFPDDEHSALSLKLYEICRDIYHWAQHFKRPELVVRGMVFACDTHLAQQEGIRTELKRGEDGSLALSLKKYGRIVFLFSQKARAVTGYRAASRHGGMFGMFISQCKRIMSNLSSFFTSKDHYEDGESNLIK